MKLELGEISNMIHLAIAPALLLVGISTLLRVLANRLNRIVRRSGLLQQRLRSHDESGKSHGGREAELAILYRRMHAIQRAITLAAICALLICVVMITLFIDAILALELDQPIGALFILAMLALIGSFVCFLHEIFMAAGYLSLTMQRSLAPRQ